MVCRSSNKCSFLLTLFMQRVFENDKFYTKGSNCSLISTANKGSKPLLHLENHKMCQESTITKLISSSCNVHSVYAIYTSEHTFTTIYKRSLWYMLKCPTNLKNIISSNLPSSVSHFVFELTNPS